MFEICFSKIYLILQLNVKFCKSIYMCVLHWLVKMFMANASIFFLGLPVYQIHERFQCLAYCKFVKKEMKKNKWLIFSVKNKATSVPNLIQYLLICFFLWMCIFFTLKNMNNWLHIAWGKFVTLLILIFMISNLLLPFV